MKKQCKVLDENVLKEVKYRRDGYLVDVILQNFVTKKVLFGASMRKEDLRETIEKGIVILWSEVRKIRWIRGENSGNFLKVVEILLNCEKDQLLIRVIPLGNGVCHTLDRKRRQRNSCFYSVLLKNKIIKDDSGHISIKEDRAE